MNCNSLTMCSIYIQRSDCVKNWLKFSFVGLVNVVVCALSFLLIFLNPGGWWTAPLVLLLLYGAVFIAEGYLLYRMTKKSEKCRYLWATILTYIILGIVIFVGIYLLSISDTSISSDIWNDFAWAFLLIITAGFLITTLAFTVITCLTVWIMQIVKRKN